MKNSLSEKYNGKQGGNQKTQAGNKGGTTLQKQRS